MDRSLLELVALGPGDEPELERFLDAHADSSMFLRSNLRHGGIIDEGEPLQATYVGARVAGALVAVAAHCWNGVLLVQGRVGDIAAVAHAAVARSGRDVAGISGPSAQVVAARAALGLAQRTAALDSREDLFTLALEDLRVPPPLASGAWLCRRPVSDDLPELSRWRFAYNVEALRLTASPELEERARQQIERTAAQWLLLVDGQRCATSAFNAQLPDTVQIGGVYTPPELRGRGYGRAVVAGSLVEARAAGVRRALLFTGDDNAAARSAYLALGFRIVGDYGLVLFDA